MWVISVIYPLFLAMIFHECFFREKRYFFHDVPTICSPLYCCVLKCRGAEGCSNIHPHKCRLIHLFLQRIARPRNMWVEFSLFLLKLNECRMRILAIASNNLVRRRLGLAFRFKILKKV